MENAEEILHFLEDFTKRKPKSIPQELNDYLAYVARTGDPVYQWSLVKSLFKEKLLNVITDFYETTPGLDIPPYPNVDPFNYDIMKNSLLERLDAFTAAPFTVQRICELLTFPRKQYNRIDKFMRAIEKNILVVSTREPGPQRHVELENGDQQEPMVNGSDNNSEYNVDVEMEDMSWKENTEKRSSAEPQPGSSDAPITIDNIEARLQAKHDSPTVEIQQKSTKHYESVTPPELNVTEELITSVKPNKDVDTIPETSIAETIDKKEKTDIIGTLVKAGEPKMETEVTPEPAVSANLVIPEITVDDAEMTEQKLSKQASLESTENNKEQETEEVAVDTLTTEIKELAPEVQLPQTMDDSSSDSNKEDINEPKLISEISTSSEESSSSSDITDGNSNSPKPDSDRNINEESNQSDSNSEDIPKIEEKVVVSVLEQKVDPVETKQEDKIDKPISIQPTIETDNYSISDVNSELPQLSADIPSIDPSVDEDPKNAEVKETKEVDSKAEETSLIIPETEVPQAPTEKADN